MLFDFDLVVPAGTSPLQPYEQRVLLSRGRITQIRVFFPPGPATLVHVVVRHNLHQLIPANYDGTLNYDDIIVPVEMAYDLVDPPYEVRLIGWSPEAVYDHRITFAFDLQPITGENWDDFNRLLFQSTIQSRFANGGLSTFE